jgi:hypothetical protein
MPNANKRKNVRTIEFSCKICITEHGTNAYVTDEQNRCHLNENTVDYICKWTQHLSGMNDTQIFNLVYKYTLTRRRHVSQPVERRRDP